MNARNYRGWTPLMLAARAGNLGMVTLLIEKGADVNARSIGKKGSPVLHFAIEGNNPAVVKALLEHGADIKAVNAEGTTPLYLAATKGLKEAAEVLISNGANVNEFGKKVDESGVFFTPLMGAACLGQVEVIELLLASGAELEKKNGWGNTPLIEAAKSSDPATLRILIRNGANVNATGREGNTALFGAAYNRRTENVRVLLEAGADPHVTAPIDDRPDAKRYAADEVGDGESKRLISEAKKKAQLSPTKP